MGQRYTDVEHRLSQSELALRRAEGVIDETIGAKHDEGKVRPSLVLGTMSRAVTEVSKVASYGATKYSDDNWLNVHNAAKRYEDALLRHYLAMAAGERRDMESELLHLGHIAWNALAMLDLHLRESEDVMTDTAQLRGQCNASTSPSEA